MVSVVYGACFICPSLLDRIPVKLGGFDAKNRLPSMPYDYSAYYRSVKYLVTKRGFRRGKIMAKLQHCESATSSPWWLNLVNIINSESQNKQCRKAVT
ncbi:hypothetical protein AVEN_28588-1 [Araneus ventricosus]|uniref:Uncharacterized protein n=1 Tax=Araneus ventricosus TaxID=182803 RepID=A0A4Y2DDP1_ARAVE|nr:hypothetical protein AVEN_28588-1 [Araneus ventricosus]